MSTKKTPVATSEKTDSNADQKTDNKNTSLTVVPKNEPAETQNPPEFKTAISLEQRLKALNLANQKNEKLKTMKDYRDNLEQWESSTDGMKEQLTIKDGNGAEFRFSNGELITKVKALLMVEMNSKISESENEILLMQI